MNLNIMLKNARTFAIRATSFGLMIVAATTAAHAQQPEYQIHMNFAANNWDAGGATNCPALYVASGVGQFVIAGGRAAVMRYAAGVLAVNRTPAGAAYAFGLVLLTQCHNDEARQVLLQAGPQNVIPYLLSFGF